MSKLGSTSIALTTRSVALTTVSSLAIIVALTGVSKDALAQSAQAQAQAENTVVDEIVVTGSRVVRDGYEAPTPVTVVGVEQIEQAALPNIADFVNQLPAFAGGNTPRAGGNEVSAGRQAQNNLNLRGLGVTRTLTMLDGHRIVAGDINAAVNVNDFPQNLVSRVDVVTGGASAAYGSDALAGVSNFILDKGFVGIKADVAGGITTYGDNESVNVSGAYGTLFASGRGHLLFSAEYGRVAGVFPAKARDWSYDAVKIITNPDYGTGAGQSRSVPQYIVRHNVGNVLNAPGGIITSGPLKGITFGPGGAPFMLKYGSLLSGQWSVGGDWKYIDPSAYSNSVDDRIARHNMFTRVAYDVTDDINVFFQFIASGSKSYAWSKLNDSLGNITIRADNAFIPAEVRSQMTALALTQLTMGAFNIDFEPASSDNYRRLWSYAGGADGTFDAAGTTWSWDVYFQYGLANSDLNGNMFNTVKMNLARDAVRNAQGIIVCRSTLSDPNNGCTPWNSFGIGVNNEVAKAYIRATSNLQLRVTEDVATAGLAGEPFELWAGPVSIATGLEYRKESVFSTVDPGSLASQHSAANYKPTIGSYNVTEGFLETVVPLARDTSWAQTLDFNGAARATSYSTSGYVTTWKLGLTYQPIDDIRFRLTRSRDIRAPNLEDLYAGGSAGQSNGVLDPFNNNATLPQFPSPNLGNVNLQPEKADTTGIGVILAPTFLPGFNASLDYFDININGAIAQVGTQETLNRCFLGQKLYCDQISRNAAGVVNSVNTIKLNLSNQHESGFDIETSYRRGLDSFVDSWEGDITLRALATHVIKNVIDDGYNPKQDLVGGPGLSPVRWRWLVSATYSNDPITLGWTGRGISSGTYGPTYLQCTSGCPVSNPFAQTIDDNYIPSAFYQDVSINYQFMHKDETGYDATAYFNVSNLMNKDPGVVAQTSFQTSTSFGLYETVGRAFRAGIRVKR